MVELSGTGNRPLSAKFWALAAACLALLKQKGDQGDLKGAPGRAESIPMSSFYKEISES